MRHWLAFIAAMALAACCAPSHVAKAPMAPPPTSLAVFRQAVFHGDTDFTPEERAYVEEALSRITYQTAGVAELSVVWDLDFESVSMLKEHLTHNIIIRWTHSISLVEGYHRDNGAWLLGYSPGDAFSHVDPARVHLVADSMAFIETTHPEAFVTVSMHEVGHVLGLPHLGDEDVMRGGYRGGHACFSPADLAAFCKTNTCGHVEMRPCDRWKGWP